MFEESKGLVGSLREVIEFNGFESDKKWLDIAISIHTASQKSHAVLVVGGPGVGKSILIDCLVQALSHYGKNEERSIPDSHRLHRIRPCAMSIELLFGYVRPDGEWEDGIFPTIVRKVTSHALCCCCC